MADSSSRSASHTSSSVLVDSILSSYQDRSDLVMSPSPIQAMLRNTTETGDLGRFSITPVNFPSTFAQYPSRPPRARLQSPFNQQHFSTINSREWNYHQPYGRQSHQCSRKSSTRTASSEILTSYRANTPGPHQHQATDLRSIAQVPLKEPQPSHQRDVGSPCPRSPFAYPTRLKRPGYRPSSPSLIDFNGTDVRTYVGMEHGFVDKQPPYLSMGARARGRPPHNSNQWRPIHSPQHGPHLRPPSRHGVYERSVMNQELQQWRWPSGPRMQNQELNMTELTRLSQTPSNGFYYDYSENFEKDSESALSASVDQLAESKRHPVNRNGPAKKGSCHAFSPSGTPITVQMEAPGASELYPRRRGQLAEWEQLGIESNALGLQYSPCNPAIVPDGEPAAVHVLSCSPSHVITEEPHDSMGKNNSSRMPNPEQAVEPGETLGRERDSEERISLPADSIPDVEHQNAAPLEVSENRLASVSKPSLEDAKNLNLVEDRCKHQSGADYTRVKTHADVPIISPKPERPLSFRNPDDKLSRILSIESFHNESDADSKPVGKCPLEGTNPATKVRSLGKKKLPPLEESNGIAISPSPRVPQGQPSFRELESYWNDHYPEGESVPHLHSPFKFQLKGHRKSKDTSPQASPLHKNGAYQGPREDVDEGESQKRSCFSYKDSVDSTEPQRASKKESIELQELPTTGITSSLRGQRTEQRPNRNGFMLNNAAFRQPSFEHSRSTPISASAPRILLRPPTPSLSFEDASSLFSERRIERRSSTPTGPSTNRASQIVDAFVVGSDGDTTRRGSRFRWTNTSFFGTAHNNVENVGEGNLNGLGKVTLGQKMKKWWQSHCKGGCFGGKENDQSGSFELYI